MTLAVDDEDDGAAEVRRWPPVYNEEDLVETIKTAAASALGRFFTHRVTDAEANQGDVIALRTDLPIIDEDGAAATDRLVEHWLVVGNTCDVARAYEADKDVDFVTIAPLQPLSVMGISEAAKGGLQRYEAGRSFYVPIWSGANEPHVADFTRLVSLHREALRAHAKIEARMRQQSWILFNACLVRLLARNDDRHL